MEKFKSFITEEKEEKYKVVVLTRKPDDWPNHKSLLTSAKFEDACKDLGLDFYMCFINGAYLSFDENNNRHIHNSDDDKGFEISDKDTLIIVRGGVNARDQWKDLLSSLERSGYCCVNSRECMEVCSDKYRTALRLSEVGLTTPTTVLIPDEKSAVDSFEKLDTKMEIWDILEDLNQLVDVSDPDISHPNLYHAFQTAEAIRADDQPEWMQLIGLIHDMGKIHENG